MNGHKTNDQVALVLKGGYINIWNMENMEDNYKNCI